MPMVTELPTVEITAIGPEDAYFDNRHEIIGAVGKLELKPSYDGKYSTGIFYPDTLPAGSRYTNRHEFRILQCMYRLCEPDDTQTQDDTEPKGGDA